MPMSPKQARRMEAKARRRAWRYVRQAVAIAARTGSISQAYIELGQGFADGVAAGIRSVRRAPSYAEVEAAAEQYLIVTKHAQRGPSEAKLIVRSATAVEMYTTVADLSSTMRAASRFQAGLTKRGLRRR